VAAHREPLPESVFEMQGAEYPQYMFPWPPPPGAAQGLITRPLRCITSAFIFPRNRLHLPALALPFLSVSSASSARAPEAFPGVALMEASLVGMTVDVLDCHRYCIQDGQKIRHHRARAA